MKRDQTLDMNCTPLSLTMSSGVLKHLYTCWKGFFSICKGNFASGMRHRDLEKQSVMTSIIVFPWGSRSGKINHKVNGKVRSMAKWDQIAQHNKTTADCHRGETCQYEPGHWVWLSTRDLRQWCKKLSHKFIGPFKVFLCIITYHFKLPCHSPLTPSFHVSRLKPMITGPLAEGNPCFWTTNPFKGGGGACIHHQGSPGHLRKKWSAPVFQDINLWNGVGFHARIPSTHYSARGFMQGTPIIQVHIPVVGQERIYLPEWAFWGGGSVTSLLASATNPISHNTPL